MDDYAVIGQNILDGHGFSYLAGTSIPTVTRAPFYPLWWAVELAMFGRNFPLLRMGEGFIDAVTAASIVFMTAALCRLPMNHGSSSVSSENEIRAFQSLWVATFAGVIYSVQPFSIYYAVKMGSETWFTLWLVLLIWSFVAWVLAPSYVRGVLMGAVLGVLLLNKSTAIGLAMILAVLGLIWMGERRTVARVSLILCVVVAAVIITPWMIRNYKVSGGYVVPIQTLTWWNFWSDFDFSPSNLTDTVSTHYDGLRGGFPYTLSAVDDVRQEAHMRNQALHWLSSHPWAMLRKMAQNLLEFWYLVEGVLRSRITGAAMVLELLLAFAGGRLAWRAGRRRMILLVVMVILYFDAVYAPIKSVFHYSLVVVPFLCVLQAFVLAWFYARVAHSDLRSQS